MSENYKNSVDPWPHWLSCSNSMQWGVLVDFFDSKRITVDAFGYSFEKGIYGAAVNDEPVKLGDYDTMYKARIAAINKANEIYNA